MTAHPSKTITAVAAMTFANTNIKAGTLLDFLSHLPPHAVVTIREGTAEPGYPIQTFTAKWNVATS